MPFYVLRLGSNIRSSLKTLFVVSELVSNVSLENVNLYNAYGASETCGVVCMFKIDKAYETCPIGKQAKYTSRILKF